LSNHRKGEADIRIGKLKWRMRLNRDVEENGAAHRWPWAKLVEEKKGRKVGFRVLGERRSERRRFLCEAVSGSGGWF